MLVASAEVVLAVRDHTERCSYGFGTRPCRIGVRNYFSDETSNKKMVGKVGISDSEQENQREGRETAGNPLVNPG
jgi:hypothetical protein